MCWCTPSLRTPCCGALNCHPSSEQITDNAKFNNQRPLSQDLAFDSIESLGKNYYKLKQDNQELREKLEEVLEMLEYSHVTSEHLYAKKVVSDFIEETKGYLHGIQK